MDRFRRGLPIAAAITLALALGLAWGGGSAGSDARAADARPAPRVVGGEKTEAGRYPWMVALADRRNAGTSEAVFCGGSLIAPDWVITANHCIRGMSKADIEAFVGLERPAESRGRGIGVRGVRRPPTPGIDIALLHLDSPSRKAPLGISPGEVPAGSPAIALGWGALWAGGGSVGHLRQVELEVRSLEDCRAAYFGAFDPATMLCAGGSGRDTCSGDSGGPLVSGGRLIGVTYFGRGCGNWPGVYTRVDRLAHGIEVMIGRDRARHRLQADRKRARQEARSAKRATGDPGGSRLPRG